MTSFHIHVRKKKKKFSWLLLTDWIRNSDLNVHSRKKKTPLVPSKRSGYLQLSPQLHINHSLHISIYTYSTLSSLQVALCLVEEGAKRRQKGNGRIAAFSPREKRGWGAVSAAWWQGKEERNSGFHQEKNAERRLLISLEEETATKRTKCFVPPDGGHVCCIVTSSC